MKKAANVNSSIIDEKRGKLIIRIFLLLFIIAIFSWLIPSTIGFINLDSK